MGDIVVMFDDGQGGYGDIMFAAKAAKELKQRLIAEGRLTGDVYICSGGLGKALDRIENGQPDLEFGINYIKGVDLLRLQKEGKINVTHVVNGPTKAHIKVPNSKSIVSSEYSHELQKYFKDKEAVVTNYAEFLKLTELEQQEIVATLPKQEDGNIKTGLAKAADEQGILTSPELIDLSMGAKQDKPKIEGRLINRLTVKTKNALFEGKSLDTYRGDTELTFGYSHNTNDAFLDIHQAYTGEPVKNQDVFLVSRASVKEHLTTQVEALKAQGYSKISFVDHDTGEEEILYEGNEGGKSYRVIQAKSLSHSDMTALTGLSGPLSLASGDQSLGEAISADKMMVYEVYPHKTVLYEAYQALTEHEDTKEALALMGVQPHEKPANPARLGELLRKAEVREEITRINAHIVQHLSLAQHYAADIMVDLAKPSETEKAIMEGRLDALESATFNYPQDLFLAIRYQQKDVVTSMLKGGADPLDVSPFGNNAFIVAAQSGDMDILKLLLVHASKNGVEFKDINIKNNHFAEYRLYDYLPIEVKNKPDDLKDLFGDYFTDLKAYLLENKPGEPTVLQDKAVQSQTATPITLITPEQWKSWCDENTITETPIKDALNKTYQASTIYERLDNLIELYEACQIHSPANEKVTEIQQQAAKLIATIGNSPEIDKIIEERKAHKGTWSTFLPNTALKHTRPFKPEQTRMERIKQRMLDHMVAIGRKQMLTVNPGDLKEDKEKNVTMLKHEEKEPFRIIPYEGKLWTLQQPEDPSSPLQMVPFDTAKMTAHGKHQGRAIFILNPQGELFAHSTKEGEFHHSSFQASGFVMYAGTMEVNNGVLTYLDDYSGHYQPTMNHVESVADVLFEKKVLNSDTEISLNFTGKDSSSLIGSQTLDTTKYFGPKKNKPQKLSSTPTLFAVKQPSPVKIIEKLEVAALTAADQDESYMYAYLVIMHDYTKQQVMAGKEVFREKMEEYAKEISNIPSLTTNMGSENEAQFEEYRKKIDGLIQEDKSLEGLKNFPPEFHSFYKTLNGEVDPTAFFEACIEENISEQVMETGMYIIIHDYLIDKEGLSDELKDVNEKLIGVDIEEWKKENESDFTKVQHAFKEFIANDPKLKHFEGDVFPEVQSNLSKTM